MHTTLTTSLPPYRYSGQVALRLIVAFVLAFQWKLFFVNLHDAPMQNQV